VVVGVDVTLFYPADVPAETRRTEAQAARQRAAATAETEGAEDVADAIEVTAEARADDETFQERATTTATATREEGVTVTEVEEIEDIGGCMQDYS